MGIIKLIAMALLLFAAFHSCRKEITTPLTEKERGDRLLAAARKWYEGNRSLPVSDSPGDISVRGLRPDWDGYRIVTNSRRQRVIGIPIRLEGDRFAEINVMLLRGRIYGTVKRYELDGQGEIKLNFYSGSGRLRRQGYYDDRHHVFIESLSPREVALLRESPLLKTMDITQEIIELEEVVITPPDDDDDDDDWWDWPEDPEDPDPYDPCALHPYWPGCEEEEGDPYFPSDPVTDPGDDWEWEEPEDTNDIIDSLQNYPCAQSVLADVPNLKNEIASLLDSVFGNNSDFNITFIAGTLDSANLDGELDGNLSRSVSVDGELISYSAVIRLQSSVLENATKEYMLATMYHEALHAYLNFQQIKLGNDAFNLAYPDVDYTVDGKGRIKYRFVENHGDMGFAFLGDLQDAILSYNPNFGSQRAEAIAQMGIVSNMSNSYKIMNDQERDSSSGNSHGTKCTD